MPSQDEYLDDLLGSLTDNLDEGKDAPLTDIDMSDMDRLLQSAAAAHEEFGSSSTDDIVAELEKADDASDSLSVDDMTGMSEEDIIKLLEAGQQETENTEADDVDDLMSLLGASEDSDLQEIQSLLQKADNNELVEDTENVSEQENAGVSERQKKQEEKKLQREAKKEAKKAAQEARLAAKEASRAEAEVRKAEKKAAKASRSKKAASAKGVVPGNASPENEPISEQQRQLEEELAAMDFLKDIPLDDSMLQSATSASADSLAQVVKNGKKEKKKGAFSRFIDFLNEEEPEEDEAIQLSDENKKILKEMDKEKKKNKKKKKARKGQAVDIGEDGESGEGKEKKGKRPKREKKPKREKEQKPEVERIPEKKLPKGKVVAIALVCVSIGLVVVICSNYVSDYAAKDTGKKAYYAGDYQTCFQSLYGKELNESEQVMYSKSESILTIRLWLSEYELLAKEGLELEALDSLIQAVYDYPTLYGYSVQWNAGTEVAEIYAQMLQILSDKYHLSEAQALEIANIRDNVDYTRAVMEVVQGDVQTSAERDGSATGTLQDKLPEEAELGDTAFVDSNGGQQ